MNHALIPELAAYKQWRTTAHTLLLELRRNIADPTPVSLEALSWYQALMALPVSKTSVLGDAVWDFNDDHPNAARNVQGAKLRLNFDSYPLLNQSAVLEVKVALYCWLKMPAATRSFASPRNIKANTAISCMKAGLSFLDTMSGQARQLMTDEFFEVGHHGLTYFDAGMYREAALIHPYAFGPDLKKFFTLVRSPFFEEQIFEEPLPYVQLESLAWAKVLKHVPDSERTYRILPNDVFEKASREASFAVVDFLSTLGEPVDDLVALTRQNASGYSLANAQELSRYNFELYVALRLRRKGYDSGAMANALSAAFGCIPSTFQSGSGRHDFKATETLLKLSDSKLDDDFRRYINFVSYSACYLVAQYTGMRPSELSEILVESCMEQESDYWLLISNVIKHRQGLAKLFDDKWIAIPIVRDAIRAACLIAKVKQNPYLFSNVDTVAQDAEPNSMSSLGITHQFRAFFEDILTDEEFESLEFSPYTLRHTLAYQMARAELGLPFISHQLKHFGDLIGGAGQNKAFSAVTLGYGAIAEILSKGGRSSSKTPTQMAEEEYIQSYCDPDGNYAGPNAESHKARMKKVFSGYMAAGYTKEQIIAQMAKKRMAIINVGQGFCYGGQREVFDESLPCIGSLRCNPNRCKNAVVTKAHAPKWREIYVQNSLALSSPNSAGSEEELRAAMEEAKGVLEHLGEEVEV
ncbi:tyrosine-type recombinase/integrase [Pseudomonas lactis]|jgi:integrase|uniref:Tyrosine-type recombinase/integrase n=2 Tax=Pseudomonas TaxID=286 RepID=A0ABD7BC56_PSEPU|nr:MULTISPECIES: tyrosine-type recombinase/integrase [Pseudomonas]KMM82316.1 integrase [Pseudomonas lundensis]MBA5957476.1 tyrosine-type recombinase/integrase [Pseudomonas lactis]MBC2410793.1 phage integrase family protein [Pseudomonas cremoris]MBV5601613.1 site-specific integrase [Pseudomonas aeruginosa]MCV0063065.1 site-specific integrase [Pseudomonas aeruginosa]